MRTAAVSAAATKLLAPKDAKGLPVTRSALSESDKKTVIEGLLSACDGLDANAIPFPFAEKVIRLESVQIALLDRVREHRRAKRRGIAIGRPLCAD